MKVSATRDDGLVYVEGEALEISLDDLPDYFHAFQWYGSFGELEFKRDKNGRKVPNLRFTDFGPFEYLVDRWKQRKKSVDDKAKQDKAQAEAQIKEQRERDEAARQEKPL